MVSHTRGRYFRVWRRKKSLEDPSCPFVWLRWEVAVKTVSARRPLWVSRPFRVPIVPRGSLRALICRIASCTRDLPGVSDFLTDGDHRASRIGAAIDDTGPFRIHAPQSYRGGGSGTTAKRNGDILHQEWGVPGPRLPQRSPGGTAARGSDLALPSVGDSFSCLFAPLSPGA